MGEGGKLKVKLIISLSPLAKHFLEVSRIEIVVRIRVNAVRVPYKESFHSACL